MTTGRARENVQPPHSGDPKGHLVKIARPVRPSGYASTSARLPATEDVGMQPKRSAYLEPEPQRSAIPTVLVTLAVLTGVMTMVNTFMVIYLFFSMRDVVDVMQGLSAYLLGAG